MKETNIEFDIGDIVYCTKGKNKYTGDYAILKQKVECVLFEVNRNGELSDVSYVLTDDLGNDRSTRARAVFATFKEALSMLKMRTMMSR